MISFRVIFAFQSNGSLVELYVTNVIFVLKYSISR